MEKSTWQYPLIGAWACVLAAMSAAQEQQSRHTIPYFPAASNTLPQGVIRVVNESRESGTVGIVAFDDAGRRFDGLSLALDANETAQFDAGDLEAGNPDAGLTGGTGAGLGDWRLELTSDLDIEPQAYVRTPDGSLAEMYATAPGEGNRYRVATFNPGHNLNQVSVLRLLNRNDGAASITVRGTDDLGRSAGTGVSIDVPAEEVRTFTAAELESGGAAGLTGSLGVGTGKWRLDVDASRPILVMSLLSSPTGHLTNLSTVAAQKAGDMHRIPLFPPVSDPLGRQGFARVINHSDRAGEVRIEAFDETMWTYEALTLSVDAGETVHFNSNDIELGNSDKGLAGSTGAGQGDWRLELTSALDLEVLSYVRMVGGHGFVMPMHDTAAQNADGLMRYYVPLFLPTGYEGQESRLHLVNLGASAAPIGISGRDDQGEPPPEGDVSLVLAAGETRVLTAVQLERGDDGLDGRFGEGTGWWQLFVTAGDQVQVMSLGYTPGGFVANLSRGVPPAADSIGNLPDLLVEALTISDIRPDAEEAFTVSASVRNQGDGDSTATTLRYYRSTNASVSTGDTEVGATELVALAASGSGRTSVTLRAPSNPGTYYYGACVDAVPGESDTTNNCSSSVRVHVSVPNPTGMPDLQIPSPLAVIAGTANIHHPGASFGMAATVENSGNGASAATTVRYYRSTDATITRSDTELGTAALAVLAASQSGRTEVDVTGSSTPGSYYYGACVDAVTNESDTSNNCGGSLLIETVPQPDLVVQAPTARPANPFARATFTLWATVRNQGEGDAAATKLHYYRSQDATISASDISVGTEAVGALDASASRSSPVTLNAPSDVGTYYYGACVDSVVDESDTANNCSPSVQVTVRGHPDLVVESPSVSESNPDAGEEFTLSATIRNQGDGDAAATTLRYYRSTDATISTTDASVATRPVAGLAASGSSNESVMSNAPSTVGTYYYGACADSVVDESDTANNCSPSVQVTVRGYPDLVVESPSVSESNPDAGEDFTLSATIRNQGDGDAAATTLRYYRSTDPTISTTDTSVATRPVAGLAASGSSNESVMSNAPSTVGTYYYGACADSVVDESDTANNCSPSVQVTVRGYPDLVVESPSVSESNPDAGEDFTLAATIRNQGDGDAAATTLRYYRSTDATISTTDTSVAMRPVTGLAASGSSNESVMSNAPSTFGTYYYGACVDSVVDESDTANNCSPSVQVTVRGYPDLVVESPSVSESNPGAGEEFTLSATIRNQGDGDAAATTLRYYRSTDAAISTTDTSVATRPVAGLAASGSSSESVMSNAPSTFGTYYYGACVDSVVDESDTANNCSPSVQVTVRGYPDLVVESPSVSESNPQACAEFTLSATVRNQGDGDATGTRLRYYRSTDTTISKSDTSVGTKPVEDLAASDSTTKSLDIAAPSSHGTYNYGACVDSVDDESNTTNNCSSSVEIVVPMGAPDLIVDDMSRATGGSTITTGEWFVLGARVANAGAGTSSAATVRFYRSTDPTITRTDTFSGRSSVGEICPSSFAHAGVDMLAPSATGTYYYGACVDSVPDESDTTNNCSLSMEVEVE